LIVAGERPRPGDLRDRQTFGVAVVAGERNGTTSLVDSIERRRWFG
jgi:hypothetical protein